MAKIDYIGTIDFGAFIGSEIIKNDDDVEGVFIPIKVNGLYRAKGTKGVKLNFSCIRKNKVQFGQTHFLQSYMSKKKYEELRSNNMKAPIFANLTKKSEYGKFEEEKKLDKKDIVAAAEKDDDKFEF